MQCQRGDVILHCPLKKTTLEQGMDLKLIPSSWPVVSLGLCGLGKIVRITRSLTVNCRVQVLGCILKKIILLSLE